MSRYGSMSNISDLKKVVELYDKKTKGDILRRIPTSDFKKYRFKSYSLKDYVQLNGFAIMHGTGITEKNECVNFVLYIDAFPGFGPAIKQVSKIIEKFKLRMYIPKKQSEKEMYEDIQNRITNSWMEDKNNNLCKNFPGKCPSLQLNLNKLLLMYWEVSFCSENERWPNDEEIVEYTKNLCYD